MARTMRNPSPSTMHIEILSLVRAERKATSEILSLICKFEETKAHLELGYSSLFEYLTKGLGYSESSAYRRIQSARLLKYVPDAKQKLEDGDLNLTQICLVSSAVRQNFKAGADPVSKHQVSEMLTAVQSKTKMEAQKEILSFLPETQFYSERINHNSVSTININFDVTTSEFSEIQQAQSQISNKLPSQNLKELLMYFIRRLNKKPTRRFATGESKEFDTKSPKTAAEKYRIDNNEKIRPSIPSSVRKNKMESANFQCEYISPITKKRCGARTYLQVDHIKPVALGGKSDEANLRIYCSSHNLLAAKKSGLGNFTKHPT